MAPRVSAQRRAGGAGLAVERDDRRGRSQLQLRLSPGAALDGERRGGVGPDAAGGWLRLRGLGRDALVVAWREPLPGGGVAAWAEGTQRGAGRLGEGRDRRRRARSRRSCRPRQPPPRWVRFRPGPVAAL